MATITTPTSFKLPWLPQVLSEKSLLLVRAWKFSTLYGALIFLTVIKLGLHQQFKLIMNHYTWLDLDSWIISSRRPSSTEKEYLVGFCWERHQLTSNSSSSTPQLKPFSSFIYKLASSVFEIFSVSSPIMFCNSN